jgi:hypothetical protein
VNQISLRRIIFELRRPPVLEIGPLIPKIAIWAKPDTVLTVCCAPSPTWLAKIVLRP